MKIGREINFQSLTFPDSFLKNDSPYSVVQWQKEKGHIIFVTFLELCDPAPALLKTLQNSNF